MIEICCKISFILEKGKDNEEDFIACDHDANVSHLWFLSIRITTGICPAVSVVVGYGLCNNMPPPYVLWDNDEEERRESKYKANY